MLKISCFYVIIHATVLCSHVSSFQQFNTAVEKSEGSMHMASDRGSQMEGSGEGDKNSSCEIDHSIPKACANGQPGGWREMSVNGVGTFCMKGPMCVAQKKKGCPVAQLGLPKGSHCAKIKTGVYGCVPNKSCQETTSYCKMNQNIPKDCVTSRNGWHQTSVEGVGTFCMKGSMCRADKKGGCPVAQPGLPKGSSCEKLKSGVYGCRPKKEC